MGWLARLVTRILTLHFWRTKDQRFGQVDHFVLLTTAPTRFAGDGPSVLWRIERYEHKFQAAKPGLSVSAIAGP